MIPAYAWADVLPDTPDETVLGTKVGRAVDPNSAVFVAVGKSIDSLTSEQQAAFINATSGTEGLESYAYFRGTMYTPTSTVGPVSATYYSTLTGTEYAMACAAARSDIVNYLKGSGSGGSGGGGNAGTEEITVPSTVQIPVIFANDWAVPGTPSTKPYCLGQVGNSSSHPTKAWGTNSGSYTRMVSTLTLTLSDGARENLQAALDTYDNYDLMFSLSNSSGSSTIASYNKYTLTIYLVEKGTYYLGDNTSKDTIGYIQRAGGARLHKDISTQVNEDGTLTADVPNVISWNNYGTSTNDRLMKKSSHPVTAELVLGTSTGSGGGDEPTEPEPTPTPPTNPTGPTITGPTINVNTGGNNSSTTTADLTPILEMLRIINDNVVIVNGNITDFETWFYQTWQNYVDWLQLWFERFGLSLDNIYAQQELVGNNIVDELREIEDVLWNIFYKPDPEYPTSTPYDDTELQGILNGMWADNNGYLNAIQNLLMQISGQIDGLDDVYTPHVGTGKTTQEQLNEDVARLKRKFPFSIPWDLYALLQFLQAPPAAPTFSFTLPYMGTLQCDLSVFDDVAAVCRWVSLLWFVAGLLACTNKLLNLMNVFERND